MKQAHIWKGQALQQSNKVFSYSRKLLSFLHAILFSPLLLCSEAVTLLSCTVPEKILQDCSSVIYIAGIALSDFWPEPRFTAICGRLPGTVWKLARASGKPKISLCGHPVSENKNFIRQGGRPASLGDTAVPDYLKVPTTGSLLRMH